MPILVGQNTGPAGPALAAMFGPPFDKSSPAQYVVRINLRSGGEATVALHSLQSFLAACIGRLTYFDECMDKENEDRLIDDVYTYRTCETTDNANHSARQTSEKEQSKKIVEVL